MPIKQDMAGLADALGGGLKSLLGELIEGSLKDLDGPVREIAPRLALAAKRKRQDLVDECKDQLMLIIIENELRLKAGTSELWEKMLGMGMDALVTGAAGGLGALKVV